jgi:leucine-rich repeat-containing protein 49
MLACTAVPPTLPQALALRSTLTVSVFLMPLAYNSLFIELAANEEDERYRYLLKNGIVRRVEDEDKIIFAELPQIPGVLVVYRKPSERNANPDRLNLDKRDLTHMPLLEGEERLRLLNLQHNHV